MNFFGRAIRYCWRQKARNSILLLVFTLLASSTMIALTVGHATAEGAAEVKKTVGASIRVAIDSGNQENYGPGIDDSNGMSYQYNGGDITPDVMDAIATVKRVVS